MKKVVASAIKIIAFSMLPLFAAEASAQTIELNVSISKIRIGWDNDQIALETGKPILNPAKCSSTDGYMTDINSRGYKTYVAAAMMAFASDKKVDVIISDTECVAQRPKILGLYILK